MFKEGTNTYIGLFMAMAPLILSWFGITPTPAFNEQFPAVASAIITLLGTAYAIYGRARATMPGWFAKQ